MRKILVSMGFIFLLLSYSHLQCMWYVVNPEDSHELLTNKQKTYLLQKFMAKAALSTLDEAQETKNIETYCKMHAKRNVKDTSCSIACPDPECESQLSSTHGFGGMQHNLTLHWYATKTHQPSFYEQAIELVVHSQAEAKKKYAVSKKPFEVVPFPRAQAEAENNAVQKNQVADIPAVLVPVKEPMRPATYFLLERSVENPGVFATFFANSREDVVETFLKSKLLEGKLRELELVQQELFDRTKKQRMVQGDIIRSLVCPAQGCKRQVAQSQHQAGEQIIHMLLVHYAAHHKLDHPHIARLVGLTAPSFLEARKNIEGDVHE